MKEKHLKYLTATALLIVGLLQLVWILHTYYLQRKDIMLMADELFFEAAEIELYDRESHLSIPVGTVIEDATIGAGQKIHDFVVFQEFTFKYNSKISLHNLDSIFNKLLKENNILVTASTNFVETDSLQLTPLLDNEKISFGAIKTQMLPIRKDGSLHIQATISSPYRTILIRIAFLLAATIIMMLFVVYCIILQIRIIVKQNRIAQMRQDFSYAMIHDMKTPLTSIMVGTQILESGKLDGSPDKKNKYIRIMKDEIDHLLALVNKILTIAKLESREVQLDRETVAIKPMIEDLMEKFLTRNTKEIEFITDISSEHVFADAEYLKEAISNLIDNAIKYSGERVNIEIRSERKDEFDRISVKDNGFGISLKDQSLIFEKFERAAATRRSSRGGATGFGLGLNYVQQVVAAHKGTVEIHSIKGEYSEFIINLPKLMEDVE